MRKDPNDTEPDRYKAAELWSRSWGAGNFDNAYVAEALDYAWHKRAGEGLSRKAYVLGFWSSYEPHEIPERFRYEALRARGDKA